MTPTRLERELALQLLLLMMANNSKVFSIHGKGLKLDTAKDIEPYLAELKAMPEVEVIRFGGNTLGVEASLALAAVIKGLLHLKVS